MFLHRNWNSQNLSEICETSGGFTRTLDNSDNFGNSVCLLGDVARDGVLDLAIEKRNKLHV